MKTQHNWINYVYVCVCVCVCIRKEVSKSHSQVQSSPVVEIKFYWNTAMLIDLCIIQGC